MNFDELTAYCFLCYDLLTGRLTSEHPLFTWLLRNGASPNDLADFARTPIGLDVLGLNFYPQWSTQRISVDNHGRLVYRAAEKDGAGFAALIDDHYRRYQVPVIVTETSAKGSDRVRARWLEDSVAAMKRLRGQGVPVLGYTWFPMFTMIDWRFRYGREPIEAYRLELGMYTLAPNGGPRWQLTPLVEQYRGYINNPQQAIGDMG